MARFLLGFFALVGGNWNNTSKAGLWYWNFNNASSNMWTTIGARLLNLFFRNLVCMSAFYNAYALVGCGWNNGSAGSLWCWNFTELSSAYGVVGARLIIWELMCKSAVLL